MKGIKRITSAALILLMVLASLAFSPGRAQAADYKLVVGNQGYSATQAASDLHGTGWYWHASQEKLTLTEYQSGRIYYDGDLDIDATGACRIQATDYQSNDAIKTTGSLNIYCHGNMDLIALNGYAINADNGNLEISVDEGRECRVSVATDQEAYTCAVRASGNVYLTGNGYVTVNVQSRASKNYTFGIIGTRLIVGNLGSSETVEVKVSVEGRNNLETAGIYVHDYIALNGNARLDVRGENTGTGPGYGIDQSDKACSINLNGKGSHYIEGSTCAIYAGDYSYAIAGSNLSAYHQEGDRSSRHIAFLTGRITQLAINGYMYYGSDLNSSFSGGGYSWDAQKQTLILDEFYGEYVEANGEKGAMFVIQLENSTDNEIYGRGEPALACSCDVAIIGSGDLKMHSDYSYTAHTSDLYIENMGSVSIEGWNGSSYSTTGLYATDVILCGYSKMSVNIHAADSSNVNSGISCETLRVGVDEYDFSSLGVTATADTDYDVYAVQLGGTGGVRVSGCASLSLNGFNFGHGGGYGVRSQGTDVKRHFSGTKGLVKIFGSTESFTGSFSDAGFRTNQAEIDSDRYYECGQSLLFELQIDGTSFDREDLETDQSGSGWFWDANYNTLTLHGYSGGSIWADGSFLDLVVQDGTSNTAKSITMYGALRISGSGRLTLNNTVASYGIYSGGSIVIGGGAAVTVNSTYSTNISRPDRGGVYSGGDVFVLNGSALRVNQNLSLKEFYEVAGIRNQGAVMVASGATGDTASVSVYSNVKAVNTNASNDAVLCKNGTIIVQSQGLLSVEATGGCWESAAGICAMPIILGGTRGPITFAGENGNMTANQTVDGRNVWYNSVYTERNPSRNKYVYSTDTTHYFALATKKTKTLSPTIGSASQVTWSSSNPTAATVTSAGKVTALTYGYTVIRATLKSNPSVVEEWFIQTRYYDVTSTKDYWFKAVYWAADNDITKGYNNVYFGPEEDCTRGQVVVFLWRMAGKPDVTITENPFADVDKSKLGNTYYNAILWAYENGITKGWKQGSKRYFKPNDPINRKDIMIMLYRYEGKPYWYFWEERPQGNFTFTDVIGTYEPGTDTYNAIAWGYVNKITNGYSSGEYAGQFGCMLNCKRKDIVTFLYRMWQHPSQD